MVVAKRQKNQSRPSALIDEPSRPSMNNKKCLRSQNRNVGMSCGFLFILTLYYIFIIDGFSSDATKAAAAGIDPESFVAFKQSFGLFHDISNAAWEGIRKKTLATSWYANPDNPLEKVDDAAWWNEHNMNPNFDCPHLEKVGGKEHEGTKFVCNPQRLVHEGKNDCLIYSVGCAGDFKFEDGIYEMYNKGCEIHIFDPADWTRRNDAEVKNIHYHAWGLSSTYDLTSKSIVWPKGRKGGFKTFPETLELLGHQNRTIDIFKIDCEGCVSSYKLMLSPHYQVYTRRWQTHVLLFLY
jgi:hypothetical protein